MATTPNKNPPASKPETNYPTSDCRLSDVYPERLKNVCRRLDFGDTDDDIDVSFKPLQIVDTEKEEKRKKWNFDFEQELPLDGKWEWERVPGEIPQTREAVSTMNKTVENRNV